MVVGQTYIHKHDLRCPGYFVSLKARMVPRREQVRAFFVITPLRHPTLLVEIDLYWGTKATPVLVRSAINPLQNNSCLTEDSNRFLLLTQSAKNPLLKVPGRGCVTKNNARCHYHTLLAMNPVKRVHCMHVHTGAYVRSLWNANQDSSDGFGEVRSTVCLSVCWCRDQHFGDS